MDEEKEISRARYKAAKKVVKKAVTVVNSMAHDRLYQKQESKKCEKEVLKLERARERKRRDLGVVICIKDENGKVLPDDAEIKERCQRYSFKLLNSGVMEDFRSSERESGKRHLNPRLCAPISKDESKEALKKMNNRKVERPDQTPMEVWKCLGEEGLQWLTKLFNVILGPLRCSGNEDLVQSSRCTRTRVIPTIVIIIRV